MDWLLSKKLTSLKSYTQHWFLSRQERRIFPRFADTREISKMKRKAIVGDSTFSMYFYDFYTTMGALQKKHFHRMLTTITIFLLSSFRIENTQNSFRDHYQVWLLTDQNHYFVNLHYIKNLLKMCSLCEANLSRDKSFLLRRFSSFL